MEPPCPIRPPTAALQMSDVHEKQECVSSQHALSQLFPLDTCNMFTAGYVECAQEAIRFLTEEEGLPFHHPMVIGLYEHLCEQRKLVHIQYLLNATLKSPEGNEPNYGIAKLEKQDETGDCHTGQTVNESEEDAQVENFNPPKRHNDSLSQSSPGNKENDLRAEETENMVAKIAEEIFSLLQEEQYYSDDDELVDEGFEDSIES